MSLEDGSYISDLIATNPGGGDPKSQGDDHLRLIKSVLKQTFPEADGAIRLKPFRLMLGASSNMANNMNIAVPSTPDGSFLIERENGTDVMRIDAAGKVEFPGLTKAFSVPGHAYLPNGLLVQWGQLTIAQAGTTVPFAIPFPTQALAVVANFAGDTSLFRVSQVGLITSSNFKAWVRDEVPALVAGYIHWIAVGF